jgi:hypothetical protein
MLDGIYAFGGHIEGTFLDVMSVRPRSKHLD